MYHAFTSLNSQHPNHHRTLTMAPTPRIRSGSSSNAPRSSPATINSLPTSTKKQLTPEDLQRMSNPLQPIAEQAPPPYDRNVDVMAWGGVESNPEDEFLRALPDLKGKSGKKQYQKILFFKMLTPTIRRKIYSYVFEYPANGKKVNLAQDFATKDVFPADFFILPWDLLHQVAGALSSGRQMRDELFTYFWNTYHFHVTFSPFSIGPVFSGLSIKFLNAYAHRVNHLTVEVDMTKLGFSACKDAKLLKVDQFKVHKVLDNLVESLARRRYKGNVMASLTLLVRRYCGFRPVPADSPEDKNVPYCPEEALWIFDVFCWLKPNVLQCRMSGFSVKYSRDTMRQLINKPQTNPRAHPIIPAWPHYILPTPTVVYHSSFNTTGSNAGSAIGSNAGSTSGSVEMPVFGTVVPSFGYSQASSSAGSLIPGLGDTQNTPHVSGLNPDFYNVQIASSTASLNSGSGYVRNTPSNGSLNPGFGNTQDTRSTGTITPSGSRPPSSLGTPRSFGTPRPGSFMTAESGIPFPSSLRGTSRTFRTSCTGLMTNDAGIPTTECDDFVGLGISLGSYASPSFSNEADTEFTRRHTTPPPRNYGIPGAARSPNTMNKLNEMDPAFTRAVEGLRLASEDKGDEEDEKVGEMSESNKSKKKKKEKEKSKKKKKGRKH